MSARRTRIQGAEHEIVCEPVTLDEVRRIDPIPSGFTTDRVFRLERRLDGTGLRWCLRELRLTSPVHKVYDSGRLDEWLASYEEDVDPSKLQFMAARAGEHVCGLATWYQQRWNNTIWLLDIRTRDGTRRAGVGSALMACLQTVARDRAVRGVTLETQANNYPAMCFYRKHGFVVAGFNDHLYTNHDLEEDETAIFLFWEAAGLLQT